MTLRAMGASNATLPVPTGLIQGFIRNGDLPFNKYVQYVPAPDVQFSYWRLDPDESVRLVDPNKYAWAYDDYSPTGKGETMRAEMLESRTLGGNRYTLRGQGGGNGMFPFGELAVEIAPTIGTPEPGTLVLAGLGLTAIGVTRVRRRVKPSTCEPRGA